MPVLHFYTFDLNTTERYEKNSDSELIDQFGDGNPIEVENDTANRAGYIMGWLRGATEAVVS